MPDGLCFELIFFNTLAVAKTEDFFFPFFVEKWTELS